MPLVFPPVDHVHLNNPPLREVICQVQFPPILKIVEERPAKFQDMIREKFPHLQTDQILPVQMSPGQSLKPLEPNPQVYRFLDRDEARTVSLSLNFYAVSTTKYKNWESFAEDIEVATEAVSSVYGVPHSTRIGLRYINFLNTTNTQARSFYPDVLDILRPELTVVLQGKEVQEPHLVLTQIRAKQEEGDFTFQFGVVKEEDKSGLPSLSFVLDFDRYIEGNLDLRVDDLLKRCDRYHADIYSAFRWSIAEEKLAIFQIA